MAPAMVTEPLITRASLAILSALTAEEARAPEDLTPTVLHAYMPPQRPGRLGQLGVLHRLGLVEPVDSGHGSKTAHRWRLTDTGAAVIAAYLTTHPLP